MHVNHPIIFLDCPSQPSFVKEPHLYGGAYYVRAGFFEAVLDYVDAPAIIVATFADSNESLSNRIATYRNSSRVRVCNYLEVAKRYKSVPCIIQGLDTFISKLAHFRWLAGMPAWPFVAMTHDLSDLDIYRDLLLATVATPLGSDTILCCSQSAREVVTSLLHRVSEVVRRPLIMDTSVVPHGIDISRVKLLDKNVCRKILDIRSDAIVFLYFGRLSSRTKSDLPKLLEIFAKMHSREAFIVFAGGLTGDEDKTCLLNLKKLAYELKVHNQVRFLTNPTDEQRSFLYSCADIFVSPANSFQESFGITLVEAMAHGLPCIVSSWDGYRDIVVDGQTGYLIGTTTEWPDMNISAEAWLTPRMNQEKRLSGVVRLDMDGFRAAMLRLLADPPLRSYMGKQGLDRARKLFDWSVIIRQYVEIWNMLPLKWRLDSSLAESGLWFDYKSTFQSHSSNG